MNPLLWKIHCLDNLGRLHQYFCQDYLYLICVAFVSLCACLSDNESRTWLIQLNISAIWNWIFMKVEGYVFMGLLMWACMYFVDYLHIILLFLSWTFYSPTMSYLNLCLNKMFNPLLWSIVLLHLYEEIITYIYTLLNIYYMKNWFHYNIVDLPDKYILLILIYPCITMVLCVMNINMNNPDTVL